MGADNSGVTESRRQEKRRWWKAQAQPFPHCAWLCAGSAAVSHLPTATPLVYDSAPLGLEFPHFLCFACILGWG